MIAIIYLCLVFTFVCAQLNGEFWWLNDKVAKLHSIEPPQPKFDDVSEFETDENVHVVFRENDLDKEERVESISPQQDNSENISAVIFFKDFSTLTQPQNKKNTLIENLSNDLNDANNSALKDESTHRKTSEDVLNFVFPENIEIVKRNNINVTYSLNPKSTAKTMVTSTSFPSSTISKNPYNLLESESICTFVSKFRCFENHGIPYIFPGRSSEAAATNQVTCCILPIKSGTASKIQFPESVDEYRRNKRSANGSTVSPAIRQRYALMRRKYQPQNTNIKISTTTIRSILTQRVVTPEDYLDPYWNVKNSKFRNPSTFGQSSLSEDDYSNQEYTDYVDEIPKPGGLVGIYSDNEKRGWTFVKPNKGFPYNDPDDIDEAEDEDGDYSFGYSTIDPRFGNKAGTSSRRQKPSKLTENSPENIHTSKSQVISFRSKPDFQVLQGFKLLNLIGNKNRFVRKTTTESVNILKDSGNRVMPSKVTGYNIDYEDFLDLGQQVFRDCGKGDNFFSTDDHDDSVLNRGSTPWLVLIVLTRSRQSILCYATLVHPRAAVTAADCVHGTSAGELSIIANVFDLSEDNNRSQHRLATVVVHPRYRAGRLSDNLAVLHWKRPLVLGSNVQPACMSDPHVGDNCFFVGWGGYDETIHYRPHSQRAAILSPKTCEERLTKLDVEMPTEAFCASVDSRDTVTGVGGPLICTGSERLSLVGVAVWRDNVILTLPVLEWVARVVYDITDQ